jgi:outer membrane lipoprotein-sorting protein
LIGERIEGLMKLTTIALFSLSIAGMPACAATADSLLAKMDAVAPKFTGMTADLTRVSYTKVLDDKSTETASMKLRREGRDIQVLIDITKPNPQTVTFGGRKAEKYYPKLNTVQEFDLGKNKGVVDQFLLVGFGTSGKDLKANYDVKYVGEETISGQKTHKLELTPRNQKMKENFRLLELWVSEDGSYPVQQRFIAPSGDYNLATYSNVKLNPTLAAADLKLKLPQGVKREYPQK